jgi:two-component system OmpR family response regulator
MGRLAVYTPLTGATIMACCFNVAVRCCKMLATNCLRELMKILVAEDDKRTADFLRKGLIENGHTVDCVPDGRDALSQCLYNDYDLLLLDRMMPGMDGLDVLKALRAAKSQVPVIFLTALADVDDRVEGLVAGGDDYLVKPFAFSELLARITVVSRRPKGREESNLLQVHDLTLDLLTRTATRGKVKIELHAKEFAMLEILMRNSGKIVTKTMLLEQVWDFNFDPRTTVVETHISRLRAKIDKPFEVQLLHTTRNTGYSLHAPE